MIDTTTIDSYFKQSQLYERIRIKEIYNNYLINHSCSNLNLTSIEDYNSFDAFLLSGSTKNIFIEYKRRHFNSNRYNTTIIEYDKYKSLYDLYISNHNNSTIYINEYDDLIIFFNLNRLYDDRKLYPFDHFFYDKQLKKNSSGNSIDKDKLITEIAYYYSMLILDKNYNVITYDQYLKG